MTLTELSEMVDKPIVILYRTQPPLTDARMRWYAELRDVGVKDSESDPIIGSAFGDGQTPHHAIEAYVQNIRGKVLVVNAFDGPEKRRVFRVPGTLEAPRFGGWR